MKLTIEIVEPGTHRPGITGCDWTVAGEDITVKVSRMSDPRRAMGLAMHEAFEAAMCYFDGVTQQQVDEFDIPYAKTHAVDLEAGDEPDSPYAVQHCFATAVERIWIAHYGISFKEYDDEVSKLQ